MDRRVTPPKRVTSPTLGPPPPCKQADHTSYSVYHACKECYHDSNTLRVEGFFFFFFENGEKNFRFQHYPDTCSRFVPFVRNLHLKKIIIINTQWSLEK